MCTTQKGNDQGIVETPQNDFMIGQYLRKDWTKTFNRSFVLGFFSKEEAKGNPTHSCHFGIE
jgi:hypothetical protein